MIHKIVYVVCKKILFLIDLPQYIKRYHRLVHKTKNIMKNETIYNEG